MTDHLHIPPESPMIQSVLLPSPQFNSPLQPSPPSTGRLPSPQVNSLLHSSQSFPNPGPSSHNSPHQSSAAPQTQLDSPPPLRRSSRSKRLPPRNTSTSNTHIHDDHIDGLIETCPDCQNLYSPPRPPRPFRYAKQPGVGVGHGNKTQQYCKPRTETDEFRQELSLSEEDQDSKDEDYRPS